MKKRRLKNYLKIGILLFGIFILFTNCQKDDDFKDLDSSTTNGKVIAKRVSINEIKQNELLKQSINKIEKQFDYSKIKNENARINATDNSFVILTDEIIEVATDTTIAYTFKIETPTKPESSFENFVITRLHDNDYQFYIYRYKEYDLDDSTESLLSISHEQVSSEQIVLADFNDFFDAKMFYDTASGCFIEVTQVGDILTIDVSDCGDLGGGYDFPSDFGGGTLDSWSVFTISGDICYMKRGYTNTDGMPDHQIFGPVPCNEDFDPNYGDNNSDFPWDNNDGSDYNYDPLHGNYGNGGTQTNNNNPSNNNSVLTVGVIKNEKTDAEKVIDCVGATNLNATQTAWLNQNPTIAKKNGN